MIQVIEKIRKHMKTQQLVRKREREKESGVFERGSD
jgi:hypothetical protein